MSFSEWKETKLGEVITLNYGKGLTAKKRIPGEVPVYSSAGLTGWHNEALINEEGIIIGRKGTVGSVYYSNQPFYCIDTAYYLTRKDTQQDISYLYYLLKSLPLDKMNTDSAVPGLNRENAYSVNINLPPLQEQKAIANILSTLDEKIETNNRINSRLEEMAQAIFKQWFVDFEFPDENGEPYKSSGGEMVDSELGMIPMGWEVKPLYDFADYINGVAFKGKDYSEDGLPIIKITELKNGFTENTKFTKTIKDEKYLIDNGDIMFSWSGNPKTSIDTFIWHKGKAILNQHIFKVIPYEEENQFYLYNLLKYLNPTFERIASNKQTTGLGHVTVRDMKALKFVVPNSGVYDSYNLLASKMFKKNYQILLENEVLVKIRDTLLPKLMSGGIRVPLDK